MIRGRRGWAVACWLLGGSACHPGLPALVPFEPSAAARTAEQCRQVFPRGQWRATHVVEAKMPFGNEGSFIGVVAAGADPGDFRSLLMTQEGFVLFDAKYRKGRVEVLRALPPLDPEGFGRGMTGDVRLMLFPPGGKLAEVGRSRAGLDTCRWREGKTTVDVMLEGTAKARILRYDDGTLAREATLAELDPRGFARHSSLEAKGIVGYSLSLSLLEVEPAEVPPAGHVRPPATAPSAAPP